MSWNEPGSGRRPGGDKDPWSKSDGPPDLEAIVKKMQMRFAGRFGGGKGRGGQPSGVGGLGMGLITIVALALYLVSGIYVVQPAERVVITRFGEFNTTVGPGPHWMPRFIDNKTVVNVEAVHTTTQGGPMLTKDENVVNVEIAIQYQISDPEAYLFRVARPEHSLKEVANSALRYVVGHRTLDEVLTRGRSEVAASIREQISSTLDYYQTGLTLVEVAMLPATPPEPVKSAFDDVIRAQEDEQRLVNESDTYARKIQPIAEGHARRAIEEANAYKQEVSLLAQGETARFVALLPEYQAAPRVTRDRLYLAAVSTVLGNTSKIIIDTDATNLMYLPLDQVLEGRTQALGSNDVDMEVISSAAAARNSRQTRSMTTGSGRTGRGD